MSLLLVRHFSIYQSTGKFEVFTYFTGGNRSRVAILIILFCVISDEDVDLTQYLDVNILTGSVKLYLRELPIPLITFDAYKEIMKAAMVVSDLDDSSQTDWQSLIRALKLLPKAHYATLNHLVQHLHKYVCVFWA